MDRFALTKWYLDCVDGDGRSAIVYSSALTWGPAKMAWHGVSIHDPARPAVHRASLASMPLPARAGADLVWNAHPLGCSVECHATLAPFSRRLLERPEGLVDWECEAPAANMQIALEDMPALRGAGYAERLVMSMPPWRLPIEELRWGRWISDGAGRSLVWIDWRGTRPRTDVYLDGQPHAPAAVADDHVQAGDALLVLSDRRTLHSRSLDTALAGLGPVLALLPSSWRAVEDTKWISRARLERPGTQAEQGWCIDELVRFPR